MANWTNYAHIPNDSGRNYCHRLAERASESDADNYAFSLIEIHPDWVFFIKHPDFGGHFITSNSK